MDNMFTGIVKSIGEITKKEERDGGLFFSIQQKDISEDVVLGSSVSVDGVCLTVDVIKNDSMDFSVMPQTISKTTLLEKKVGEKVNLEPSLKIGDEVGGHFVYGHVDSIGKIKKKEKQGSQILFHIGVEDACMEYIVPQGSISINGVSLTVAEKKEHGFTVAIVDYTFKKTTFNNMQEGDIVNIETDMLAKYVKNKL